MKFPVKVLLLRFKKIRNDNKNFMWTRIFKHEGFLQAKFPLILCDHYNSFFSPPLQWCRAFKVQWPGNDEDPLVWGLSPNNWIPNLLRVKSSMKRRISGDSENNWDAPSSQTDHFHQHIKVLETLPFDKYIWHIGHIHFAICTNSSHLLHRPIISIQSFQIRVFSFLGF